jgi:predicted AlkP superfamily phosphohydrolase/phosphomutase
LNTEDITKVIVLGIDGIDPGILESLMAQGELRAFVALRDTGSYGRLATSNPAQSPVAWSTIATGCNPGCHGIFDFFARDPDTYLPHLSLYRANPLNVLRKRDSMFSTVRKGKTFWSIASQAQIPTALIKWPLTLPPERIFGHMLSGLGVPDLKTTLGRYSFFTTRPFFPDEGRRGDFFPLLREGDRLSSLISGPHDARIPLRLTIREGEPGAILTLDGEKHPLRLGVWSDWIRVRFSHGFTVHISGICRFYLMALQPDVELYMTPLQVDPENPAFPISYPDGYAASLAREIGLFHTLGAPEDTQGLVDGCLDSRAFLESCDSIMKERERLFMHEMRHFKEGLLACVFDTTDKIQHIFWAAHDESYPAREGSFSHDFRRVIEDYYVKIDGILARALEIVDEQTLLIILSDHGFTSFRRSVHLNSWLEKAGLMKVRSIDRGKSLFQQVVWEKTAAYSVGFSSIYMNLYGREMKGIVKKEEKDGLKQRIARDLKELRDPLTGGSIVREVYDGERLYSGPRAAEAPDLIIGFNDGYRCSWQSALGGTPDALIEDNRERWSGDHLVDPSIVPGILAMNRKVDLRHPCLLDIAPTILDALHIAAPEEMEGASLLRPARRPARGKN